jgi:hypothetical protein
MWQMLCSEYPFYHGTRFTTVIIDKPTGHQRYVIDSTDTFIEQVQVQVQFTDSHRFFWKGSQKANCLLSDRLLARPLSDKSLPHVTFIPPVQ